MDAAAQSVLKNLPKGRPRKTPRHVFILQLARLYEDLTGQRPIWKYDSVEGKGCGSFFDFVYALLESINKEAVTGLDGAIRRALKSYGKKPA